MKTRDIVISGGGIPGLALASLLLQSGLDVVVLDPNLQVLQSHSQSGGRTSALMEGSIAILDEAGIWDIAASSATDLHILSINDEVQNVEFRSDEIGLSKFGSNISNSSLQTSSAQRVAALSPTSLQKTALKDFSILPSYVEVSLTSGENIRTKLLVGADGRHSLVRKISGIETRFHDYDQMAITALLSHTKPHFNRSTEFHRPGGPFTLVPMKGLTSSLVWLETTQKAKDTLSLSRQNFENRLQDLSQGILGKITLSSAPEAWPLKMMQASSYIGPRIALIAEAAHVISPIGAQGLNLSLRDAQSLADTIIDACTCGLDHGSQVVLKKYENSRSADIDFRVTGTHLLNQSVASKNFAVTRLRQLGLRIVSGIPQLRILAMLEGLSPGYASTSGRTTRARVKTSTL